MVEYTWDNISKMCDGLYNSIDKDIDLIVGIGRGGFIPAVILSHKFKTACETVTWQTRDNNKQEYNRDVISVIEAGKSVLFVDDINDSGRTMNELKIVYGITNKVYFSVVINKLNSSFKPDFTGLEVDSDEWVVFPWEE